jgi:hypothetical protein
MGFVDIRVLVGVTLGQHSYPMIEALFPHRPQTAQAVSKRKITNTGGNIQPIIISIKSKSGVND